MKQRAREERERKRKIICLPFIEINANTKRKCGRQKYLTSK
jgi:hypothetical protein